MGKPVSQRTRVPWRGGLAALIGTPALTVWGPGGEPDPVDPEGRWPLGYSLDPVTCTEGWRWDPTCGFQATTQIDPDTGAESVVVDEPKPDRDDLCEGPDEYPFGIGTSAGCSILNEPDPVAKYAEEVMTAYDRAFWRQLAAELWSGDIIRNMVTTGAQDSHASFLTNDDSADEDCGFVDLSLTGPDEIWDLDEALFELDHFLIRNSDDAAGLVHADWKTLWRWCQAGLLDREGQYRWRTKLGGFYVVSDPRYLGTSPLSQGQVAPTAEATWAYATGPLEVRIYPPEIFPNPTEAEFSEMVNHQQNYIRFIAEGLASVTWQCAHAGLALGPCPRVGA